MVTARPIRRAHPSVAHSSKEEPHPSRLHPVGAIRPRDPAAGYRRPGRAGLDIAYSLEIGAVAAGAAILGSMLGLGGGVFLVPILTLYFGVDPKLAVGASAVVVVTNSVVGSTNHLRSRFTNPRLAMLLQIATAAGAIAGALFGVVADPRIIYGVFGAVLVYAAVSMVIRRERHVAPPPLGTPGPDATRRRVS